MLMKIINFIILFFLFFLISGFAVIKQPIFTAREYNYTISKNKILQSSFYLNSDLDICGIVLLASINKTTNFSIEIFSDNNIAKKINIISVAPALKKYQTLKILFDETINIKNKITLKISADSNFDIWYSNYDTNSEKQYFLIDNEKISGALYFEIIRPLNFKKIITQIIDKFFTNKKFAFFYSALILLILSLISFNKKIQKIL